MPRPHEEAPDSARPLVIILGPTAVGKTGAAVELCRALGGEIISCDSMQVYRGFDIGTAKPGPESADVTHHLVDICDPDETFSAADFVTRTLALLPEIERRGRLPVVVGGTGLYLRALLDGIFEGPPRNPEIRSRLRSDAAAHGLASLYQRLGEVDPAYQARVHQNDPVRIIRALEVWETTGVPISIQFERSSVRLRDHRVLKLGLLLPRRDLYARIDLRVDAMLAAGLVGEAMRLLARQVSRDATPFKGLGYRQSLKLIDGECDEAGLREEMRTETRRYAKRQLTWFRRERGAIWLRPDRSEWIIPLVRRWLL